ncbi:MAG: ribonuclease H family protein [Lachnospiraceae bacterium]|nr:ribonuclease H family protein [Lachnospiraceae bacterium]
MKFYAVRRGRIPGVYENWSDCEAQVKGFPSAVYKSFPSLQEAELFLQDSVPAETKAPAWPEIYVDGSFRADTGEYSYGLVVLEGGEEQTYCEKFDDPELAQMRNVAGEIRGAQAAMELALAQGWPGIFLYHDYAGIANWCTGEWKAAKPGTVAYRDYYRRIRDRLTVQFIKVKGHSHDRYNDLADQLAKEALGIGGAEVSGKESG